MALLGAQPCTLYSHVDSPKGELNVHVHYLTYQFNIPMHQVSILLFRGTTAMFVPIFPASFCDSGTVFGLRVQHIG